MRRVPLWGAIVILIILIFVAISGGGEGYSIDQGKIWTVIGINSIFVVIGIVRTINDRF